MTGRTKPEVARQLDSVNLAIHDHWFHVKDVTHDVAQGTLSVRFTRPSEAGAETTFRILFLRRVRVPITEWWLEIRNVENYTLEETEGIQQYDFNKLEFSEVDRTLTVRTGVPLVFHVRVSAVDISVRDTGSVVAEKVYTTI